MPEPWQGSGDGVVRWLFSELPGTAEHLLAGAAFAFLHDLRLSPGAATGQKANPGLDKIYYVVSGAGRLYHRPTPAAPSSRACCGPGMRRWCAARNSTTSPTKRKPKICA
jgi:hypothetical protein